MALTQDEKVRVRHHLGYLNVEEVATFALGVPANVQTQFMIEPAMDKVLVAAEEKLRSLLGQLDAVEFQIFDDTETLVALKVGSIEINPDSFDKVLQRYLFIRSALANVLGIIPNPYDKRFFNEAGGAIGINVAVNH